MTKTGEYTFKVRTVPGTDSQKNMVEKSEWIESGELSITDRYVSDGKGQQTKNPSAKSGTTDTVGWVKKDNIWNYRFPDGSICVVHGSRSTDTGIILMSMARCSPAGRSQQMTGITCMILGKWRPDGQRSMVSGIISGHLRKMGIYREPWLYGGWKIIGADYYFFREDGSLYTGWLEQNGSRYYLNTLDNSLQGAMFTGWLIREGKTYFLDADGVMATGWYQV